jgi:hypothetical protein
MDRNAHLSHLAGATYLPLPLRVHPGLKPGRERGVSPALGLVAAYERMASLAWAPGLLIASAS